MRDPQTRVLQREGTDNIIGEPIGTDGEVSGSATFNRAGIYAEFGWGPVHRTKMFAYLTTDNSLR